MQRRLEISEIGSLNDPFELLPFNLSDPEVRNGFLAARKQLGSNRGLLCFSSGWDNPVMWAHYGENHRGLVLGFDVPDNFCETRPVRPRAGNAECAVDEEAARKFLFAKYAAWAYEAEVRVWSPREEKIGGLYFKHFGEDLRLEEIILGAGSGISPARVIRSLGEKSLPVEM